MSASGRSEEHTSELQSLAYLVCRLLLEKTNDRLTVLSSLFFFFNDTATTEIYTLSLHDALPISLRSTGRTGRDSCHGPPSPAMTRSKNALPPAVNTISSAFAKWPPESSSDVSVRKIGRAHV